MSNAPLLSIVIPVYNGEQYIKACLDSLCRLVEVGGIEIIVIDDGSTDESRNIIFDFAKDKDGVVLVRQNNGGVSSARNHGIQLATGKYVMFLDGDDWLSGDFSKEIIPKLKENHDCLMFGFWESFEPGETGAIIGRIPDAEVTGTSKDRIYRMLSFDTFYGGYAWNKIIKRDLLFSNGVLTVKFDEHLSFMEDEQFWLQAALTCDEVLFLNKAYYCYRVVQGSLSRKHTTQNNLIELEMKERSYLFAKQYCPEVAEQALARIVLAVGGFIRRYYVLQDREGLESIREYWGKYPGKRLSGISEIPFVLKAAALLCDGAMALRLPLVCLRPLSSILSKGMPE